MRIELTIKVDYLPTWGAYEGIRELVQNGKDAETEFNAKLEVRHRKETDTLVIENEGCSIPHEALLFGHTTKTDRPEMIGKFGEGLKLGVLALVRAGHAVKIRSGSEVWIPSIEHSEKFSADVLVFNIERGRAEKERVQIEIDNVSAEEWADLRTRFLFLVRNLGEIVSASYGSLLLGKQYAGKLYVKGIFVEADPKLKYGYNLTGSNIALDRDRKMVQRYELDFRMREIWASAIRTRPDLVSRFFTLLEDQAADVNGIDEGNAHYMPKEAIEHAREQFLSRHGKEAVPVGNLQDSHEVEHLGKRGIIVPKPLKSVLQAAMGTTEALKEALKNEALKFYSWGDLDDTERGNLGQALLLVSGALGTATLHLSDIDVVDFRSSTKHGMFKTEGKRIMLAKHILSNRRETIAILVHEVAHREGDADGTFLHVKHMEAIWGGIVETLLKPSRFEHLAKEDL